MVLVAGALAACSKPVHDVGYHLAHPEERKAALDTCRNNPGQLGETPNCINAKEANSEAMLQRFRDVLSD